MKSEVIVIKKPALAEIKNYEPAKLPIGDMMAMQGTVNTHSSEEMKVSIGVWESTPGLFARNIKNREFSHIISGWCIFTPKNAEPIELRAGDAVMFPENCEGIWDIRETLRKTYVIFDD